ncbi:MAG: 2,3-diaminopropionate biosynthesis protein SbnA [Pseudomonas sp.]|uniref:2,3-diaminopropionate biosynthesis protein SbnA n=1 Tax=Pseudomonas sp. TaxID=306 RepID=UPI003394E17D
MIHDSPASLVFGEHFLSLKTIAPHFSVNLKLEGLSISGSIKIKSALHMLTEMEKSGQLRPGMRVIESSSGNLGLALSMLCAIKGYPFVCISDPNISRQTAGQIKAFGAELIIVQRRDENGGYLQTRIDLIRTMLQQDARLLWINQYENTLNVDAHYQMTGPEILSQFARPDYLFVGAGTTGTLGGVSRYVREQSPSTVIVAVDSVGSVTFGHPPGKRLIPGLGTSSPPPIRAHAHFDQLLMIEERDSLRMCHDLAAQGVMLGGSSGTVLCAVRQYAPHIPKDACVVAISPDMGDRYIDTLYNPDWIQQHFQGRPECLADIAPTLSN